MFVGVQALIKVRYHPGIEYLFLAYLLAYVLIGFGLFEGPLFEICQLLRHFEVPFELDSVIFDRVAVRRMVSHRHTLVLLVHKA